MATVEPASWAQRVGRGVRAAGAFIGLAAAAALILGLQSVAAGRRTTPAPTVAAPSPVQGINFGPAQTVLAGGWDFGPYLASAHGELFMAGQAHMNVTPTTGGGIVASGGAIAVFSSADGVKWQQASEPGAFHDGTSRLSPLGFSDDGDGGLILVGNAFDVNTLLPAMAWHSSDGRSWTQEKLGGDLPAQVIAVTARPGAAVAFGQLITSTTMEPDGELRSTTELAAWLSADGQTWSQTILPDSAGYLPRTVTAWKGGFVAIALKDEVTGIDSTAWTSADGRNWQKASTPLAGFDAAAMTAPGDRVVAVGSGMQSPSSWSSTDGRVWHQSTVAARDPVTSFCAVTVVGDTLVGIGVAQVALPADTQPPGWTAPPAPPPSIWISTDGAAWRLLAEDPALHSVNSRSTAIAGIGERVVVATQGTNTVDVSIGDLVR